MYTNACLPFGCFSPQFSAPDGNQNEHRIVPQSDIRNGNVTSVAKRAFSYNGFNNNASKPLLIGSWYLLELLGGSNEYTPMSWDSHHRVTEPRVSRFPSFSVHHKSTAYPYDSSLELLLRQRKEVATRPPNLILAQEPRKGPLFEEYEISPR